LTSRDLSDLKARHLISVYGHRKRELNYSKLLFEPFFRSDFSLRTYKIEPLTYKRHRGKRKRPQALFNIILCMWFAIARRMYRDRTRYITGNSNSFLISYRPCLGIVPLVNSADCIRNADFHTVDPRTLCQTGVLLEAAPRRCRREAKDSA
jgi:hypothetical protein